MIKVEKFFKTWTATFGAYKGQGVTRKEALEALSQAAQKDVGHYTPIIRKWREVVAIVTFEPGGQAMVSIIRPNRVATASELFQCSSRWEGIEKAEKYLAMLVEQEYPEDI